VSPQALDPQSIDTWPLEAVREIEHRWIPLSDGTRLSARIWLPASASAENPVPAILEYIPYRKDDATAAADAARYPYFAERGFAGVRVDLRGTGDSDGICADEYLRQEQDDALEVFAWLAEQDWCSGKCGMIGHSWGGFNGLQVAARRPPQLKAVVTMYSTDDRYADDCHYQGGCLLASDMLKWAEWMHALNARPADPRFVGDAWREGWLSRLRETPPYIEAWMAHPTYDAFWRQGSVIEDYSAIEAAVLAVGGWTDAYTNAVPRLLEHLTCPRWGIIGPWGHVVPSRGVPGPAIGFLQECLRFFDHWLRGAENGVDAEPLLRTYLVDTLPPAPFHAELPGRWVAEQHWPPTSVTEDEYTLTGDGRLAPGIEIDPDALAASQERSILGDQTCGITAGVWCVNGMPDELPADQAPDDALSLCFNSPPHAEPIDLLGRPVVRLRVSADQPQALVSARLCSVAPDGVSTLVTWGLLNLTHRLSCEAPLELEPGEFYDVTLELNAVGQRIPAGHVLRVAITPTYFPQAWPSPVAATLTVATDGASILTLPVRVPLPSDANPPTFLPAEESAPLVGAIRQSDGRTRTRHRDPETGVATTEDHQSYSAVIEATGTTYAEKAVDRWSIAPGDPLSACVSCDREITIDREGWHVRIVTTAEQTCTAEKIITRTTLQAFEGDTLVFVDDRATTALRENY
jgi:uncharacterized protein